MPYQASVLITGGTTGLRYQSALAIARQYPEYQIIIASRSDAVSAAVTVNSTPKQKNVAYLPLDLASLANVRSFVVGWEESKYPPIRALLLNAGLQFSKGLILTYDGLEATFAINHAGHALLCLLLLSHMQVGRIVSTASDAHDPAQKTVMPDALYTPGDELAHPTSASASLDGKQRYTTSKLVNVLRVYALRRHLTAVLERRLSVAAFIRD